MSGALEVRGLRVSYPVAGGWADAVDGVDLRLERASVHAVVGESGSGKSTLGLALAGLTRAGGRMSAERLELDGRVLAPRGSDGACGRSVGVLLQESALALDPRLRVGRVLERTLADCGAPAGERRARAAALLERVGFEHPGDVLPRFPHELSGGMRQRVQLAWCLASGPSYLIADEPTASLDPLLARRTVELLRSLAAREGLGVLLVTHDLAVAVELAGRLSVMYCGRIVERGPAREVLRRPAHPYTRALVRAVAAREPFDAPLVGLPGRAPQPLERPRGCAFAPRCTSAQERCAADRPVLEAVGGVQLACPPSAQELRR